MIAVQITAHGGPEVLVAKDLPDPAPGAGQVRVQVKAVGVNFADILMRMGLYPGAPSLPFTPGYKAAGVVEACGGGVTVWRPGDRVIAPTNFGGYASRIVARADELFRLPDGKSFEAAAALTVNYMTAYLAMVEQGNLREGQRVLVHGAAGGVGIAAVQIARILGAEIYGTASSSKHEILKAQGVKRAIDYRREDFEDVVLRETRGQGVHLALDPVGGSSFTKSYRSLARGGKLVLYGMSSMASGRRRNLLRVLWEYLRTPRFSSIDLMTSNKGVIGLHLGRITDQRERLAGAMRELVGWWEQGKLEPMVGATFPLELAGRAHEFIQQRQNIGKVVLTVGS
jgi:NADPH:quinone reductase-like Zn-dependent oxidoreductase